MRFEFRQWLLRGIDFKSFPPPGSYVKGIPIVTVEGLITSIERKAQLYRYAHSGCYNTRAVSTLDVENFFGLFHDLDPRGGGVISPDAVPRVIATSAELFAQQVNPKRTFQMRTSDAPVYPCTAVEDCDTTADEHTTNGTKCQDRLASDHGVILRDHAFDRLDRRRTRPKRKSGDVKRHDQPGRGVLPVRSHHKRDESKILPHIRLGINIDDSD